MSVQAITSDLISDDSAEVLYEVAYDLYRNGKYGDAEKCFLMLTLQRPTAQKFWKGLGACHEMMKSFEKAVECYGVAAILEPNDPLVLWHAAGCLHALGNEANALQTLKLAITIALENPMHTALIPSLKDLEKLWSNKLNHK